jgi:hypothetical protein
MHGTTFIYTSVDDLFFFLARYAHMQVTTIDGLAVWGVKAVDAGRL